MCQQDPSYLRKIYNLPILKVRDKNFICRGEIENTQRFQISVEETMGALSVIGSILPSKDGRMHVTACRSARHGDHYKRIS